MKNLAIIGSGVVGSATGKGFIEKGHKVIFYDIREDRVNFLKKQGLDARHSDFIDVSASEAFFLTVSTPTENGEINLRHIENAVIDLGKKLKEKKGYFVIIVRSTVLPKTTEELVIPVIERESGKKVGVDFGVSMNPEYLREKNAEEDFKNPWLVTIGSLDKKTEDFMREVFKDYKCPIHYVSLAEAEMQKYVHNLFNAIKIAFFNEMRTACDLIGINPDYIFEITADSAEGFWNKKYGLRNLGPFDGMCLPKDTQAFLSWAEKKGIEMDLLKGAISSNDKFRNLWRKKEKV